MSPPLATLLASCLLAAAGAAGGWYLFADPASSAREVTGPRARAVPVETALAEAGRAATRIRATGTLRASDAVVVQPEIAGRVINILFDQGQAVAAGTPLIMLAPETFQAELTMAEAALVLAQENFERSEELSRRGATAAQALDEARAKLRTAEAEVDRAKVRLSDTVIAAPFDGVVGLKEISVGRYVEPGDELVALERIDPLYLDFRLSERWLSKLAPGDTIAVTVDALPGQLSRAPSRPSTPRSTSTAAPCSCAPPCPIPTAACGRACSHASTSSSTSGRLRCWSPKPRWSSRSAGRSSTGSRRARRSSPR